MFTRKERLNNECTHREFFGQFVTQQMMNLVVGRIGGDKLLASTDEHLNDIPLRRWDALSGTVRMFITSKQITDAGLHGFSLSDCVCTAKEAARQWMDLQSA